MEIKISLNSENIRQVQSCTYLGLEIDDELKWKLHIEKIKKKLLRFVGIFYKLRDILPTNIRKQLYFALIYPHIIYGIETYANTCYSYLEPLIVLNNKILRILQNKKMDTPIKELYKSYNTIPIPELHIMYIAKFVYKCYYLKIELPEVFQDYYVLNDVIHDHFTRNSKEIHEAVTSSKYGFKSVRQKGGRLWNGLPNDCKKRMSLNKFCQNIKNMYYLET